MKILYERGFFKIIFAWYDFWRGFYYDVGHRTLYWFPIPMLGMRFQFPGKYDESKHRQDRHKWPDGR